MFRAISDQRYQRFELNIKLVQATASPFLNKCNINKMHYVSYGKTKTKFPYDETSFLFKYEIISNKKSYKMNFQESLNPLKFHNKPSKNVVSYFKSFKIYNYSSLKFT